MTTAEKIDDLATNGELKWIGKSPLRPDGVDKVTGRAKFGADLFLPNMLVGRVLRSPHPHARIRSIDTSKAAALPGVKAVITGDDLPDHEFAYVGPERLAVNFWHITRNILAREKVLYEGHAVAAAELDHAHHLAGVTRQHHRAGPGPVQGQAIAFVGEQLLGAREATLAPDDRLERVDQAADVAHELSIGA